MLHELGGLDMLVVDRVVQQIFLVGGLQLCKVALNPVELRAVGHVEDLGDVKLLEQVLCILGLVHAEVVKEEGKVPSTKLLRQLLNE